MTTTGDRKLTLCDTGTSPSEPGDPGQAEHVRRLFSNLGHAFQHAVLSRCDGLPTAGLEKGSWAVRARDFPVELKGTDVHIDGVLEWQSPQRSTWLFAIVECKRVDPECSDWCFARSTPRDSHAVMDLYFRRVESMVEGHACWVNEPVGLVVQVGLERRAAERQGQGRRHALNDAVAQALRGAGGFASRLPELIEIGAFARIVPVIITTARLYVWRHPLNVADLSDGELPEGTLAETDWLWYESNVRRSLLPDVYRELPAAGPDRIGNLVLHQHRRLVMITTPQGLHAALSFIANQRLEPLKP